MGGARGGFVQRNPLDGVGYARERSERTIFAAGGRMNEDWRRSDLLPSDHQFDVAKCPKCGADLYLSHRPGVTTVEILCEKQQTWGIVHRFKKE